MWTNGKTAVFVKVPHGDYVTTHLASHPGLAPDNATINTMQASAPWRRGVSLSFNIIYHFLVASSQPARNHHECFAPGLCPWPAHPPRNEQ